MSTANEATAVSLPPGMDETYYALHLLRQRRLEACVAFTTELRTRKTAAQAHNEQLWCIQAKAMILQSWYNDAEIEDDGVDQVLLEGEQAVVSTSHRPATSLTAAATAKASRAGSAAGGRTSAHGTRPGSIGSRYGYARPGSHGVATRPGSRGTTARGGTAGAGRAMTSRFARLGTASLAAVAGGPFIDVQRLPLERLARQRPMVAKLVCDYLLYVEHKPRLALELCQAALNATEGNVTNNMSTNNTVAGQVPSESGAARNGGGGSELGLPPRLPPGRSPTSPSAALRSPSPQHGSSPHQVNNNNNNSNYVVLQAGIAQSEDWWWKARLAKASYQLGLLREAERYYKAALFERSRTDTRHNNNDEAASKTSLGATTSRFANYHTTTIMELGKVYNKMDQPLTAMELYMDALSENPVDHHVLLCAARLYDQLHEPLRSYEFYTQVLGLDSSCVEAVACVAAYCFYEKGQPELALRYYRRLLQMGVQTTEVWNNVGLCAYYSDQLDIALGCFYRALQLCTDDIERADVWYNIGHVGIGLGDVAFAERALRLAVRADRTHAEALNNLAVLALHKRHTAKEGEVAADNSDVNKEEGAQGEDDDEVRRASVELARHLLRQAVTVAPELPEALYNSALLCYRRGDLEETHNFLMRALDVEPDHAECVALQQRLHEAFIAL